MVRRTETSRNGLVAASRGPSGWPVLSEKGVFGRAHGLVFVVVRLNLVVGIVCDAQGDAGGFGTANK